MSQDFFNMYYEDNFLPQFYLQSIKDEVLNTNFPWYYRDSAAGTARENSDSVTLANHQYGFHHTPFNHEYGWSNNGMLFRPIIGAIEERFDIRVDTLIRIRLGMLTNIGQDASHYPHVDYNYPHKTVLLYLDNSDGDTVFYNEMYDAEDDDQKLTVNMRHAPVENRAVMFEGLQYHSSSAPITNSRRITMNINFISG